MSSAPASLLNAGAIAGPGESIFHPSSRLHARKMILINCTPPRGRERKHHQPRRHLAGGFVCAVNWGKSRDEKESAPTRSARGALSQSARRGFARVSGEKCLSLIFRAHSKGRSDRSASPLFRNHPATLLFTSPPPPPSASTTHNQWQLYLPRRALHPGSSDHPCSPVMPSQTRTFRSNSISNQQPINWFEFGIQSGRRAFGTCMPMRKRPPPPPSWARSL